MQIHHFAQFDRVICISARPLRSPHTGGDGKRNRVPAAELMHETGLAADVYRIAREAADARGGGKLESVALVVGELAGVEPDLIVFAWEAAVEGTPDAGARLTIQWSAVRQTCASCGEIPERAAGSWLRLCPRCDGPLAVSGGDELDVRQVSFLEGDLDGNLPGRARYASPPAGNAHDQPGGGIPQAPSGDQEPVAAGGRR
jgi:hydrogenase nickel incorporation protein HypA/HybF